MLAIFEDILPESKSIACWYVGANSHITWQSLSALLYRIGTIYIYICKGLITLCIVPLAFWIFHAFFSREKTQEKCKKNTRKIKNASPTREKVSILHYALCKNVSQLCFARVLLAFCTRFARVLLIKLTKTQTQRIV